jgi:hypothetical protein
MFSFLLNLLPRRIPITKFQHITDLQHVRYIIRVLLNAPVSQKDKARTGPLNPCKLSGSPFNYIKIMFYKFYNYCELYNAVK